MPCSTSRRRTDSPVRSSPNPIMLNAATAIVKAAAAGLRTNSAATTSPRAIGAPPPRGVGTVCDDRGFGTSIAAARRSSEIVSGSDRATTEPHETAAITIVNPSDTCPILPGYYSM